MVPSIFTIHFWLRHCLFCTLCVLCKLLHRIIMHINTYIIQHLSKCLIIFITTGLYIELVSFCSGWVIFQIKMQCTLQYQKYYTQLAKCMYVIMVWYWILSHQIKKRYYYWNTVLRHYRQEEPTLGASGSVETAQPRYWTSYLDSATSKAKEFTWWSEG